MATRQQKRLMFCYAGSKRRLMPLLTPLFPPHKIYLSPFFGSGADILEKEPSWREIVNDVYNNVCAVFTSLRDERLFPQLVRRVENSHDCNTLYYDCYDRLGGDLSLLDRAYCYLMVGNLGFQGVSPLMSRSYGKGLWKNLRFRNLLPAIYWWRDRMKRVEVENRDVFELLDLYDSPDVFAFCDPPYHPDTCRQDMYKHNTLDHLRLLKRLQRFTGRVMLCGYPHSLYDLQLLGWRRQAFRVSKNIGGPKSREEVVWMNYDDHGDKIRQDLGLIRAFEQLRA